jgi:transposase-like protein
VLVELGVVEQRYRAVLEVLEGAEVTDVAKRYGVARQTVHAWLRRYALSGGLGGLVDRSSRPDVCPHQMSAEVEARIIALRKAHPAWGATTLLWHLAQAGVAPLPAEVIMSSTYRTSRVVRVLGLDTPRGSPDAETEGDQEGGHSGSSPLRSMATAPKGQAAGRGRRPRNTARPVSQLRPVWEGPAPR